MGQLSAEKGLDDMIVVSRVMKGGEIGWVSNAWMAMVWDQLSLKGGYYWSSCTKGRGMHICE